MRLFLRVAAVQTRCLFSSMARQDRGCIARAGLMLAYAVLAVIVVAYSGFLGVGLALLGAADAVPAVGAAAAALIGLVFTVCKASSVLYEASDYGTMMSWPIPGTVQVAARIAPFAAANVAMAAAVCVPMAVGAMGVAGADAARVAALLACVALGPLPTTAAAVLLAAGITLVTARLPHAKAAYTAVAVLLALLLLVGYFALVGRGYATGGGEVDAEALSRALAAGVGALCTFWPPAGWLREAWAAPGAAAAGGVALFCLASAAAGALCLWLVARTYRPVMGALQTSAGPRRAAGVGRARGALGALCRKEVAQVLDTTSVVVNDLLGLLLMVVLAGAVAYMGVDGALAAMDVPGGARAEMLPALYAALPWALAFCGAMAPVPAVSVSLEGRCAWLMQTAPVPVRTLMASKVLPWLVACAAASAVSAVLVAVGGVPVPVALLCVAVPCADFWFTANLGLFLDARSPDFSWTSPAALAKRGVPITVSVIVAMVSGLVAVGLLVTAALVMGWSEAAVLGASLGIAGAMAVAGTLLFRASCDREVPRQAADA